MKKEIPGLATIVYPEEEDLRPAAVLDASESILKAISLIVERKIPCVVVFQSGKYKGVIESKTLKSFAKGSENTRVGNVARRAPILKTSMPLEMLTNLFFHNPFSSLPVFDADGVEVLGAVDRYSLLVAMVEAGMIPKVSIASVMTSPVLTVEEKTTIAEAKSLMRKNKVSRLVVTKNDYISGILSTHDLARIFAKPQNERLPFVSQKSTQEDKPVASFMNTNVHTVGEQATIADALSLMLQHRVSSIVVEKNRWPVGIISVKDILEFAIPKEEDNIIISGLDEKNRGLAADIREECSNRLKKISRIFRVDYIAVHVKQSEAQVSVRLRISLGGRVVHVHKLNSAKQWNVMQAFIAALDQLEKMVMETEKPRAKHVLQKPSRIKKEKIKRELYL